MNDYKLYQSKVITENYDEFVQHCVTAKGIIVDKVGSEDTTWSYGQYNTFNVTSCSPLFYDLLKELKGFIRDYTQSDERIWMQSWMNFHTPDNVLDWHGHPWQFHGYIAVDPKKSKTIFKEWEIENKIGQVYIGPGSYDDEFHHKVEVSEPYDGDRITIGFDCTTDDSRVRSNMIPLI